MLVADVPVVDCVLVVEPAPVTSALAKLIAKAPTNIAMANTKSKLFLCIYPPIVYQHFQRRLACLILELGSLRVFADDLFN